MRTRYANPCRYVRCNAVLLIASVLAGPCFAQTPASVPPTMSCFELFVPGPKMRPAAPLRFNRCTGESWMLVRESKALTRKAGTARFRWVLLEVEKTATGDERQNASTNVQPEPPRESKHRVEKCYTFAGRQFCE